MKSGWRRRGLALLVLAPLAVALVFLARGEDTASAPLDVVQAGHDLLETDSGVTEMDFSGASAIPADFFGPGSDPFTGTVALEGVPFDSFGAYSGLLPTDTIVERKQDAVPVFPATIDIEIVALELKSIEPITVTWNGGQDPNLYDVTAQVLDGPVPAQSMGSMTIRHEFADGGTFDAQLPVTPRFTFTNVDPEAPPHQQGPVELDGPQIDFEVNNAPWCHTANPLDDPLGHVVVEVAGLTSNFFPGITCGLPRTKATVVMTAPAPSATAHGIRPAEVALAETAQAGHDLLETDSSETRVDLSGDPIPADFFGPGSDPFDGTVALEGVPFDSFGAFSGLLPTDTIVERLENAGPGFPDAIEIEIVALSLRSIAPIIVTYNGGQDPEEWDMTVEVLEGPDPVQQQGTMTIRHEYADGGTFDAQLPVKPRLTFRLVSNPLDVRVLDWHQEGRDPFLFEATGENWCHTANPLDDPPGHVVVEVPELTSNFFPGITCQSPRTKGTVVMTAAGATAHGIRPAENLAPPVGGIADLPPLAETSAEGSAALADGSGWTAGAYAALVGGLAAAAVAFGGGAWYARRRFSRS